MLQSPPVPADPPPSPPFAPAQPPPLPFPPESPPTLPPLPVSPPSPPVPPNYPPRSPPALPPPTPPIPPSPPPHSPPLVPLMPPPPDVCVATDPCGPNSQCIVVRQTKKRAQPYLCKCNQGFKGDPYSSGPDKCRDEQQLYLEELFGMNRCYGCKYEPAIYGTYESVNITRVLDVGTGACGVVRKFIQHGLQPSVRPHQRASPQALERICRIARCRRRSRRNCFGCYFRSWCWDVDGDESCFCVLLCIMIQVVRTLLPFPYGRPMERSFSNDDSTESCPTGACGGFAFACGLAIATR